MGVAFRLGRDGKPREHWYGEYKTKVRISDEGNPLFERSRAKAIAKLEELQGEEAKGRSIAPDGLTQSDGGLTQTG